MSPEGEVFPLGSLGMLVPSVGIALCLRHGCAVCAASGGGDTGMPVARLTEERQSGDKDCSARLTFRVCAERTPGARTAVAGLSGNPQGRTASTDRCLKSQSSPDGIFRPADFAGNPFGSRLTPHSSTGGTPAQKWLRRETLLQRWLTGN